MPLPRRAPARALTTGITPPLAVRVMVRFTARLPDTPSATAADEMDRDGCRRAHASG